MRKVTILCMFLGWLWPSFVMAAQTRVAAAGSLREVLPALISDFQSRQPDIAVVERYGASGQLAKQIIQGAPDDLFLSADASFARIVADAGLGIKPAQVYALGTLVLFRSNNAKLSPDFDLGSLEINQFDRLAIAQPDNAPYGRAARAALQEAGLWKTLQPHLAVAENVAQAAQFVRTGNVELAMIAKSQALVLDQFGDWREIALPVGDHLRHEMVLIDPKAEAFFDYLTSPAAARIFATHGFEPKGQ